MYYVMDHLWIDEQGAFLDVIGPDGYTSTLPIVVFDNKVGFCICQVEEGSVRTATRKEWKSRKYLQAGQYRVDFSDGNAKLMRKATKKDRQVMAKLTDIQE